MSRFWSDREGNIAVLFALTAIPLLGVMGVAVDYSMAAAYRTDMQKSLDATALALAKLLPASQATLDEKAQQYFHANMGSHTLTEVQLSVVPNFVAGTLNLSVRGVYTPQLATILGIGSFEIGTKSQATWSRTKLEVALAFDLSSSMAASHAGVSKVDAAKEAASELVDTLFEAAGDDDPERLKISVVPYTSTVNVGTEYKNAAWLDQNGISSAHWAPSSGTIGGNITKPPAGQGVNSRFDLFDWLGEEWGGCVETRPGEFAVNDEPPTSALANSLFVPYFAPDEPGIKGSSAPGNNLYRNWLGTNSGYRAYNSYLDDHDQADASCGSMPTSASSGNWTAVQQRWCKYKIDGDANKKYFYTNGWGLQTGPNFMCNPTKLLRLSTNQEAIKNKISQFQALGDTSIFEGVAWAWRTVSPNTPFSDGRAYDADDNMKILIMLTDGNNNWLSLGNPNQSLHAAQAYYVNRRLGSTQNMSQTQANTHLDDTTRAVCTNAKQKGVVIYAVVFSLENNPIPESWKDLVIDCASVENGETLAYFAEGTDQLKNVFKVIAGRISQLHLSN